MKKIIRAIISAAIVLALFTSCGPESNDTVDSIDPMGNFLIVYDQDLDDDIHIYIIRDNNTNVLYMYTTAIRKAGLTPLINSDGSPVTYNQWILEYDDQTEEGDIEWQ